jgi:diguanylate cyclase (GGDEF)-like protein/PAS domain S-box-containing protein
MDCDRGARAARWHDDVVQPAADLYGALVESSHDAIVATALDGTVQTWNRAAEEHYGYTAAEMLGRNSSALIPPDRPDELRDVLARLIAGERIEHYDTVRRRKDGSLVDMSVTISPIVNRSGLVVGVSTIARDITERKRVERLIEHQALHDSLTDLPNRVLLYDRIEGALARVRRNGGFVAVLFMDLDNFKLVNDQHGHLIGDLVLRKLGPRLQTVMRHEDTLARLGGDEFVIVCAGVANPDAATALARRITQVLVAPFDISGTVISVTASIGVTIGGADDSVDELLGYADAAMYAAKTHSPWGIETLTISDTHPAVTRRPATLDQVNRPESK